MSTGNIIKFPKEFKAQPQPLAYRHKTKAEAKYPKKYHDEIFEFADGSYIILVQPKKEKFTLDRMAFMAWRLQVVLSDLVLGYEEVTLDTDAP